MSIQLRRFSLLIPVLMGVLAFLAIIGFTPLIPGNVGWLSSGDPFQHYIGWEFFRNSEWSFPIGLNPDYGLEISSSIVYSDSIPGMAILFKLLLALHSPPFQYFGLWLLICFVLQSIAAWQLIGLVTKDSLTRAIFIIPFIFSAPMLGRLTGITTHYALVAHFLILFALYLCLCKSRNFSRAAWLALLAGSLSVHFYLFVMVGVLWVASLLDSLRSNRISRNSAITYFIFTVLVTLFLSWQLGYFIVSPQMSQIEGYGWHSFNLISPINSKGWSWLMSPLKISHETNEDFNYLGIGVLACLPISIYGAYKYRLRAFRAVHKNLFLIASLVCLSFFAASHHISIGEFEIHFPLAKFLETPTSLLRSSARMFWPAYYALIFLVLYLVIHTLPRKLLILYAAIVFSVQILDTSIGWAYVKKSLRASEGIESASPLKSPFWSLAAINYKNLKTFPLEASQMQKNWGVFSNYCALNHMGTDIVYLARIDHQKIKLSNSIFLENISKNKFPSTDFYIIHPNYVPNLVDLIGIYHFRIIDGFYVFSPKGFFNIEIPLIDLQNIFPKITYGRGINFSSDSIDNAKFLARGWSHQESWGVWSDGKEADILLPPNILAYDQIQITYRIYNPNQELKRVYVSVNAGAPQEVLIKSDGLQKLYLKIPRVASNNQIVKVHFDIPDAISPANLRGATDNRNLGIGLVSVVID